VRRSRRSARPTEWQPWYLPFLPAHWSRASGLANGVRTPPSARAPGSLEPGEPGPGGVSRMKVLRSSYSGDGGQERPMDRRDATVRDPRPGRRPFPARQPTTSRTPTTSVPTASRVRAGRAPAGSAGQVRATGVERRPAGGFQPRRRPRRTGSWAWPEAQQVPWREGGVRGLAIVCLVLATVVLVLSWLVGSLGVLALGAVVGLWGLCVAGWAILGRPGVDWTVPTRRMLAGCARAEPLEEPATGVRRPDTWTRWRRRVEVSPERSEGEAGACSRRSGSGGDEPARGPLPAGWARPGVGDPAGRSGHGARGPRAGDETLRARKVTGIAGE